MPQSLGCHIRIRLVAWGHHVTDPPHNHARHQEGSEGLHEPLFKIILFNCKMFQKSRLIVQAQPFKIMRTGLFWTLHDTLPLKQHRRITYKTNWCIAFTTCRRSRNQQFIPVFINDSSPLTTELLPNSTFIQKCQILKLQNDVHFNSHTFGIPRKHKDQIISTQESA